mmetsp:Transcript_10037/g.17802  ORF Transcript_10037/g.17802 Transcript_10037/m.17802 type:complete len:82 (+) Transcript_10037:5499-5744(+)
MSLGRRVSVKKRDVNNSQTPLMTKIDKFNLNYQTSNQEKKEKAINPGINQINNKENEKKIVRSIDRLIVLDVMFFVMTKTD